MCVCVCIQGIQLIVYAERERYSSTYAYEAISAFIKSEVFKNFNKYLSKTFRTLKIPQQKKITVIKMEV